MKKIITLSMSLLLLMSIAVMAGKPNGPAAYNGLNKGNSDVMHLELYEKDINWDAVVGGAWGKMVYSEDSFVFNGHGLVAGTDYTLINYDEAWSSGQVCLAAGTSNNGGNINLAGDTVGTGKIWLVLSSDVNCDAGAMIAWNPSEYLFEYNTI